MKRKKALLVIDVQPVFLKRWNRFVVPRIVSRIRRGGYALCIESVFHAERGSLWDRQTGWTAPKDERTRTETEILEALREMGVPTVHVVKQTKSAFKGMPAILPLLRRKGIEEVHIVGLDTNDCVLATAYEAFDIGFYTKVIEGCVMSSGSKRLHGQALSLLRRVELTDRSKRF